MADYQTYILQALLFCTPRLWISH